MTVDDKNAPDKSNNGPAEAKIAEHAPSKRKKERPSFERFVQILSETISGESTKDTLSAVVRTLNRGFSGEVQPDHVNRVVDLIKNYRSAHRLAVQLTTALHQKPSGIARAVLNRLRSWCAELVQYPPDHAGEDRLFAVTQWILAGNHTQGQPEAPRFPAEWLRMAFTCLASERDPLVRCEAVYRLLSTIAGTAKHGRGGPFRSESQTFLHEAAQLVSAKTISPRKVATALQFAHPMEERSRQHEATVQEARNASLEASQKARTLAEENTQLRQQLESALARANELGQQSERLAEQLSAEEERLRELEKFWAKRSEQELARQRHQVVTALAHDLQEARLALDRESPIAGMALNRVRRAEETVRNLGQPK